MNRRGVIGGLVAYGVLWSRGSLSQEKARIKRIGFYSTSSAQGLPGTLEAFRQGMAALGWGDGRDYFIDARYADNRRDVIDKVAADRIAAPPATPPARGPTLTHGVAPKTKMIT